jgi:hypothetical protein
MRFLTTTVVSCGLFLSVGWAAAAPPPPPPKFWSQAHCERVVAWHHSWSPSRQVICVGTGGPSGCRWTSGHRARLYSEFMVFTRYDHTNVRGVGFGVVPGVVRSVRLSTRARPGFVSIRRHFGDQYAGWTADFFTAHRRLLATGATSARFRSIVAPMAARGTQQENATGCTGG